MITTLDKLAQDCSEGDLVTLHFQGGNYLPLIYAGVLKGKILGENVSEELLFVRSLTELKNCRKTRSYIKISSGFTSLFPGIQIIGYARLREV